MTYRRAYINGKAVMVKVLGWRTLKKEDMTSTQDTGGNSLWEWFAKLQPNEGQYYGFNSRRDRRSGVLFTLNAAATTATDDSARIRIVIYYPDGETQKCIILDETYLTLKSASRVDIENLITYTATKILQPGDWLVLECNDATIVDISESVFELGTLMMTK